MAKKYLDENGLLYFWQKIKTMFALVAHTHTKSQITDFPTSMTPSSHTHGNITNAGALQSTDITIASGDKLVVTDANNSSKVARTSVAFDGSTTTKALTQKGTFETFLQEHQDISGKVDKVDGKGLSTNDYTTAEKNKLAGIATGAEVNVQSDWNQSTTTADDFIKNKPSTFTVSKDGFVPNPTAHNPLEEDTWSVEDLCFMHASGDWYRFLLSGTQNANNYSIRFGADNSGGQQIEMPYTYLTLNGATTTQAGVMPASDKVKLNKLVFDSNNLIDSSILPSYVDDVIEAYPRSGATELSSSWLSTSSGGSALTPETGKIYVLMADSTSYATNTQFRWGGTTYVKLSDSGVSEITNAEIDTIVAS